MKALSIVFLLAFVFDLRASETLERARQLEESGDGAGARALLANATQSAPGDIAALTEYAEFLDRHADPAALEAYGKLLAALDQPEHRQQRAAKLLGVHPNYLHRLVRNLDLREVAKKASVD
jgi:thioredoxin-like negative regulator of GroEL